MIYYPDYMGFTVKVIDNDNNIIEGTLISYDHGYDEEPEVDYDSISIKPTKKGYCITIPIIDIIEFEVIE